MSISVVKIEADSARDILAKMRRASWRQFPCYAELAAARVRASSHYVLVKDGQEALALANVRIRKFPFARLGLALISHGPVLLREEIDWSDDLNTVLEALKCHICHRLGMVLRIDPEPNLNPILDVGQLGELGFGVSEARSYRTIIVDTSKDLEVVRGKLAGKWRTDLNRAERGGLVVTSTKDPGDFAKFAVLLDELSQRKGFVVAQDAGFFAKAASSAREPENFLIHAVWEGGTMVSGHIGAFSGGTATYLLGATSARGRELRAAHLAQWAVIKTAIGMGIPQYDLGGIDEERNPEVFRFKKRMGGTIHHGVGELSAYPSGFFGFLASRLMAAADAVQKK